MQNIFRNITNFDELYNDIENSLISKLYDNENKIDYNKDNKTNYEDNNKYNNFDEEDYKFNEEPEIYPINTIISYKTKKNLNIIGKIIEISYIYQDYVIDVLSINNEKCKEKKTDFIEMDNNTIIPTNRINILLQQ